MQTEEAAQTAAQTEEAAQAAAQAAVQTEEAAADESDIVENEEETNVYSKNLGPLGQKWIDFMMKKKSDNVFGPSVDVYDRLKWGTKFLKLKPNDEIRYNDVTYIATPAIYELIFSPEPPEAVTQQELSVYKNMLKAAKTHLKGNGQIKSSTSAKYKEVIRKIFPPSEIKIKKTVLPPKTPTYENVQPRYRPKTPEDEQRGGGLMNLNRKRVEFIYFNTIDELVERLELLVRETESGHTGHNNEILSILEELHEQGVIKKPGKLNFLSV